ncbi:MAG: ABC transporter ATP-binding protein [Clostridia bacterium]|nr:ABC transporter ATP-binding protein [Clostridia bacterium]
MDERIRVIGLSKMFGSFAAVDNVGFTVRKNEFFSLLGPSGCGKTTTLRCVAGLEEPTQGEVYIGQELVTAPARHIMRPPERRGIGMVFQNYAVWPHMTVEQNISYPLKLARWTKARSRAKTEELLGLLELTGLGKRYPSELSGGQQQRVALGRALAMDPEVMLLDEPLSNLDAKLREQMRFELKDLQRKTGIAILYVTHDQVEAMAMSDRVAVMNKGVIIQEGPPDEIYRQPATQFVADFIGTMNFIQCEALGLEDGQVTVRLRNGMLVQVESQVAASGQCVLAVRPEDITLNRNDGLECQVEVGIFLGNSMDYRVRLGEDLLRVHSGLDGACQPGERAYLKIGKGLLYP